VGRKPRDGSQSKGTVLCLDHYSVKIENRPPAWRTIPGLPSLPSIAYWKYADLSLLFWYNKYKREKIYYGK